MGEQCTICGASAEPAQGAVLLVHEGVTFRFCSLECLKIFQAYPETYTQEEEVELRSVEDSGL